ncbi:hypothetical protein ACFONL_01840, partial [Camelimonas fluminis]
DRANVAVRLRPRKFLFGHLAFLLRETFPTTVPREHRRARPDKVFPAGGCDARFPSKFRVWFAKSNLRGHAVDARSFQDPTAMTFPGKSSRAKRRS